MIREDISSDPRTLTPERPKRDYLKERQDRKRTGSRAEFDPRSGGEGFKSPHRAGRGGDRHVSERWPTRIYRRRILTATPSRLAGRWIG